MNLLKYQKSQFNLDFANNTILSCFFFFFLIIDLYLLISVAIAQIFNLIAELVIAIELLSKEVKAKSEMPLVIVEAKIRCSIWFRVVQIY